VFTQVSGSLHIEIVESYDQIKMTGSRQVGDGVDDVWPPAKVRHMEEFINVFARPRFILILIIREEDDV
jgi:hypothetical protein